MDREVWRYACPAETDELGDEALPFSVNPYLYLVRLLQYESRSLSRIGAIEILTMSH